MTWSIVLFLYFKNFTHCIKEPIPLTSCWFCSLNSIHSLKAKWTIILIDSDIGLRIFKPVQIIRWWTDTDSFINGKMFILEIITDIQNPGSIRYSNIYSGGVRICHGTVGLIKINYFNLRNTLCTVTCKKFPWIRTVAFLNPWIN